MIQTAMKKVTLHLPAQAAKAFSAKDIVEMLRDKALTKTEYFRSKNRFFEGKYNANFAEFKQKVAQSSEENFVEWDDLLLWEGYNLAFREWNDKYQELKSCQTLSGR